MNINLNNNMSKKLVTASEKMNTEEALMIMKNHEFRHLPVVDNENNIVGIISDRDLYKALNTEEIEIGNIMSKNIYKFDIKTDMKEIVEKMITHRISSFLVTRDSDVAGIITSEDMLQLLAQLLENEKPKVTVLEEFLTTAFGISNAVKNPNLVI